MDYYNKYYIGIFWLPEYEEHKISATLFIDINGVAQIHSIESIIKGNELIHRDVKEFSVVVGYINSNEHSYSFSIKLYNVITILEGIGGGLNKYIYRSNDSIISNDIDIDLNSLKFKALMLSSALINKWINITGFKTQTNKDKVFKSLMQYEQPQTISLFKNNEIEVYLYFEAESSYYFNEKRQLYINENIFFHIKTSTNIELNEINILKRQIENLITILLFSPFNSTNTRLISKSQNSYYVLYKQIDFVDVNYRSEIDFNTFKEHSNKIFSNWFEKQDKLDLIIKNFFSVFGRKGIFEEDKLLKYIFILENYSKNNITDKEVMKTLEEHDFEFDKEKKEKKDTTHTLTLVKNLIYLIQKSSVNTKINGISKFAIKLKKTRVYYVHLEENKKKAALTTQEIKEANVVLEYIIREILLREIGLDVLDEPKWINEMIFHD